MSNEKPVLSSLNVVVRDMQSAIEFYRLLGVEIPDASVWRTPSGAHHVDIPMPNGIGLDLDSEDFAQSYNTGWRGGVERGAIIGFSLATREAVDECYANLTSAGYKGPQPPYDAFWGARYAVVEDPDGNPVGLMSPLDPSRRSDPPSV